MTTSTTTSVKLGDMTSILRKNILTVLAIYAIALAMTVFYFAKVDPTYRAKIEILPASQIKSADQRKLEIISLTSVFDQFSYRRDLSFKTDITDLLNQERILNEFIYKLKYGGQFNSAIKNYHGPLQLDPRDTDYEIKVATLKRGLLSLERNPDELEWYLSAETTTPRLAYLILKDTFEKISFDIAKEINQQTKNELEAQLSVFTAAFVSTKSDLKTLLEVMEESSRLIKNRDTTPTTMTGEGLMAAVPVFNIPNGLTLPMDSQAAEIMAMTLKKDLDRLEKLWVIPSDASMETSKKDAAKNQVIETFFQNLQGFAASIPNDLVISDLELISFKSTRNKPISFIAIFLLATLLIFFVLITKQRFIIEVSKS